MESDRAIATLAALAQPTRLDAFRRLVRAEPEGIAAGDLARGLGVPANTLSSHLAALAQAGLVAGERRGRSVVYRARLDALRDLMLFLLRDCCGGEPSRCGPLVSRALSLTAPFGEPLMPDRPLNVLFLCTGNSARSILGEALLNHLGRGRFRAFSAGSHPKGAVHPMALEALERAGVPTEGLRSKPWDEFAEPGAPRMDFVFTVCDAAAGETCPVWPGQPVTAHWGIEDPAAVEGPEFRRRAAFDAALDRMRRRIEAFAALPFESLDRLSLAARLRGIGGMEGATERAGADGADSLA